MPKSIVLISLLFTMSCGMASGQVDNPSVGTQTDDTKKLIDQKDVEIHNLKEELEYIKKELLAMQKANRSLRDSLQDKRDTLDIKSVKIDAENENLRILHQTIEDDHRLSQEIISELQGLPANAVAPDQPAEFEDDIEFRSRYNEALNQYFDGKITASLNNFRNLLELRQDHALSDNCQYWLGECLYSQEKYVEAIIAFQKVKDLGDGNKADAALFKIGLSYLKLNKKTEARSAFSELEIQYPQSELVPKARQYNVYQEKF